MNPTNYLNKKFYVIIIKNKRMKEMYIGRQTTIKIDARSCPENKSPEYKSIFWGMYEKFNCKLYMD